MFEFIFENLVDATKYNVEAKAFLQQGEPAHHNENISSLICELNKIFLFTMIKYCVISVVSVSQPATIYQTSNPFAPKMIPSMPGEVV